MTTLGERRGRGALPASLAAFGEQRPSNDPPAELKAFRFTWHLDRCIPFVSHTSAIRALQRGRIFRALCAPHPSQDVKRPKVCAEPVTESRSTFGLWTFSSTVVWDASGNSLKFQHGPLLTTRLRDLIRPRPSTDDFRVEPLPSRRSPVA